jgi:hypothetical protein
VVEFVVNDDMVKEVLPSRERIIEVLESVGFDAERQALPVASLSGELHAAACSPRLVLVPLCRPASSPRLRPGYRFTPSCLCLTPCCLPCAPPPRWLEDEAGPGARHAHERRHHAAG